MNFNFFSDNIAGNWIVQSTHYSSNKKTNFIEILTNEIEYKRIININSYQKLWLPYLKSNYLDNKAEIYSIESKKNNIIAIQQYLLILNEDHRTIIVLKFNNKFKVLNKFIIKHYSKKYLSMISQYRNITVSEKIYFLSSNLKIIKTIVTKNKKCCTISFSSEIRIS